MIYFKVVNTSGVFLSNAQLVILAKEGNFKSVKIKLSEDRQLFEVKGLKEGDYEVSVSCKGYEAHIYRLQYVENSDVTVREIRLGKQGAKYLKLGGRSLCFENPTEELVLNEKIVQRDLTLQELIKELEAEINQSSQKAVYHREHAIEKTNEKRIKVPQSKAGKTKLQKSLAENAVQQLLVIDRDHEGRELFLGDKIVLKFDGKVDNEEIKKIVSRYRLIEKSEIIQTLDRNKEVIVQTQELLSFTYLERLTELSQLPGVMDVNPYLSMKVEPSYTPSDFLYGSQWSLRTANVSSAWELLFAKDVQLGYGSSDVIVNVYDTGVQSNMIGGPNVRAVNQDFNQNIQGGGLTSLLATQVPAHPAGQHKVYHLSNISTFGGLYNQIVFNTDNPGGVGSPNSHGTCCAGIIVASGGTDAAFPGNGIAGDRGVTGIAANARLMSTQWDFQVPLPGIDEVFRYLSGLNPGWNAANHNGVNFNLQVQFNSPQNVGPGYSISNHSHTWPSGLMPSFNSNQPFTIFIDGLVSFGRKRRGAFILFAASNMGRNIRTDMVVGLHEKMITVAGSSLNSFGFEERTSYSDHGNLPATFNGAAEFSEIDFCAPTNHHVAFDGISNDGVHWFHNPPINYGIFTTDLIGLAPATPGNTPSNATNSTQLTGGPYNAGVGVINVAAPAGFVAGNSVRLRNAAGTVTEYGHIAAVAGNQVTLRDVLKNGFVAGDTIDVGPATHTDGFSGTSAACPFACGVLALVISANPKLSFWEARHILKSTAEKIDLRMFAPTGVPTLNVSWTDASAPVNNIVSAGGLLNTNTAPTLANYQGTLVSVTHAVNPNRSTLKLNTLTNLQVGRSLLIGVEARATAFPTANSVRVNNVAGFAIGQQIRIYDGATTHLALPSPSPFLMGVLALPANRIMVGNAVGFDVGHVIQIGPAGMATTEIRTITAINYINAGGFGGHLIIALGPDPLNPMGPSNLANPHPINTIVQLANQITRNITNIVADVITFSGAAINPINYSLAVGSPPVIIREVNTEIAVIREINTANDTVVTNRLINIHPANTRVVGGFIPHYSPALGSGRVDAYYAVKAALAYTHNERDLIIRNYLGDDGISVTNPDEHTINSPDIWIQNAAAPVNPILGVHQPVNPLPGVLPNTYADSADTVHQKPRRTTANSIYVRVGNRGAQQSFDYSVHIRLALKDVDLPVKLTVDDYINGPTTAYPYLYTPLPNVAPPDPLFAGQIYNLNSGHPGTKTLADIHSLASSATLAVALPVGRLLLNLPTIPANSGAMYVANLPIADRPTLPFPFVVVRTTVAVAAGVNTLTLEHTRGFSNGQQVLIGRPTDAGCEKVTLNAAPTLNTISFAPNLANAHAQGTFIIRLENVTTNLSALAPVASAGSKFSILSVNSVEGFKIGNHIAVGDHTVVANIPNLKFYRIVRVKRDTASGTNQLVVEPAVTGAVIANGTMITQLAGRLKTFALGEVTPHDGILDGSTPESNNNISYKEINFGHDVFFRDSTGNIELPKRIQVASNGTSLTTNFRIYIKDPELFTTEKIIITVNRRLTNGTYQAVTYYYKTSAPAGWNYQPAAPAWIAFNAPLLTSTNAAASGNQSDIYFSGSFNTDNTIDEISITVNVEGQDGARDFITTETYTGKVFTIAGLPNVNDAGLQDQTGMPALAGTQMLHAFADMTSLEQTKVMAFGPLSDTQFKFTSSFNTSANPAAIVNAYAVLDGIVFIQRNIANNTINLVLKPLKQAEIGFNRVKYFIYRGLKEGDFFTAALPNELITNASPNPAAHFVDSVKATQNLLNPGQPVLLSALGWDPANQHPEDMLDDFFFNSTPSHQLPVVKRGMTLGTFKNTEIGFEIVLAEGAYPIRLSNIRQTSYTLDVSTITNADEKAAKREEILNYIDPAAYFGMHYLSGILYPQLPDPSPASIDTVKIDKVDLYTTVVAKFATKNTLYVDIRNENGYSYNYYGNYTQTGADQGKSIRIGFVPAAQQALSTSAFNTQEWPVMIYDNSSSPANNPEAMSAVYMQLSTADNGNPVSFFEYGNALSGTTNNNFAEGTDLLETFAVVTLTPATNTITVTGDISALQIGNSFSLIACDHSLTNAIYKVVAKAAGINPGETNITVEAGTLVHDPVSGPNLGLIHFAKWTKVIAVSYPNHPTTANPNQKLNVAHVVKLRYFRQAHETGGAIVAIDQANRKINVRGLTARILTQGDKLIITNSDAMLNNGTYTIAPNGVMQINNDTQITVEEAIPAAFNAGVGFKNGLVKIKLSKVPAVNHYTDHKFGSLNAVTRQFKITAINVVSAVQSVITISGDYRHILSRNTRLSIRNATTVTNNGSYVINGAPVLNGANTDITITTASALSNALTPADQEKDLISVLALPWRSDQPTQWLSGFDFRYLDTRKQLTDSAGIVKAGFAYMGQTGVAVEQNRIIFHMTPLNFFKTPQLGAYSPNIIDMNGGTSSEQSFWKVMQVQNQNLVLNATMLRINPGPVIVPVFDFVDDTADAIADDLLKSNFLSLCITQAEFLRLKEVADAQLNNLHDLYIVLRREQNLVDANGVNYKTFELAVSGFARKADNSLMAHEVYPSVPVVVYSLREDAVVFTSKDFADVENTEIVKLSYEESQRMNATALNVYALNPGLQTHINTFNTDLIALNHDFPAIKALVQARAQTLWNLAVSSADAGGLRPYDDRQLYWARLHARNAIREHAVLKLQFGKRKELMKLFEEHSRGFHTVSFAAAPVGAVKILVIGYDPFDIATNYNRSNPSGSIALYLHGKTITKGAKQGYIQSMVFPVRYGDFNAGTVERILGPWMSGANKPDMIVTCSMDIVNYFNADRFASKFREPNLTDNESKKGGVAKFYKVLNTGKVVPTGGNALAQFIEGTLPVSNMDDTVGNTRPGGSTNQILVHNQTWTGTQNGTPVQNTFIWDPDNGAYNPANAEAVPAANVRATSGSGGTYLSNEIFYRVALMRTTIAGSVGRTGHLHVPKIQGNADDFSQANTTNLVQNARTIITDALSAF